MATKKPAKPGAPKTSPKKLQELAAKPPVFDDEEQLVDHSGVFRVTSAIQREQIGHGDDTAPRFANDSLVMAAQRAGFPEEVPPPDEEAAIEDAAAVAAKRARLATLAALAQKKKR